MKSRILIYMRRFRAIMSAVKTWTSLIILGGSLSLVLWASGKFTPIINRVAGLAMSEVNTATADGDNGTGGWGG